MPGQNLASSQYCTVLYCTVLQSHLGPTLLRLSLPLNSVRCFTNLRARGLGRAQSQSQSHLTYLASELSGWNFTLVARRRRLLLYVLAAATWLLIRIRKSCLRHLDPRQGSTRISHG